MRHYSKHSVKQSVRFTASTHALVQEFRTILTQLHPDMFSAENALTFAQVVDRAVSAYLADLGNDEASLKIELDYYRSHGYMRGCPRDVKDQASLQPTAQP